LLVIWVFIGLLAGLFLLLDLGDGGWLSAFLDIYDLYWIGMEDLVWFWLGMKERLELCFGLFLYLLGLI
jgi:hypothetical protein